MGDQQQQQQRQLAVSVAQAVQARFNSLPKNGKNQPHEHSVLAGIVAYHEAGKQHNGHSNHHSSCCSDSTASLGLAPRMHVIAIGTGTKCLGASKRSPGCDVLNDSHAEVITRRTFLVWVYQQLMLAVAQRQEHQQQQEGNPLQQQQQQQDPQEQEQQQEAPNKASDAQCTSAFYWCPDGCKFRLHRGIKFAMYVSQPPCGDASIYEHDQCSAVGAAGVAPSTQDSGPSSAAGSAQQLGGEPVQQLGQAGLQPCTGRTGAKLIRLSGAADVGQAAAALAAQPPEPAVQQMDQQQQQDNRNAEQQQQQQQQRQGLVLCVPCACDVEAGPQQLGALRRKPGKGDPTLSLSCSDKIARWACLGLQGCLLSSCLAEPLHLQLLVVSVPPGSSSSSTTAAGIAAVKTATGLGSQAGSAGGASGSAAGIAAAAAGTLTAQSMDAAASNLLQQERQQQKQQGSEQQLQDQPAWPEAAKAVEAAGTRAFNSRLASCAAVLQPPFQLQPPAVFAVEPPDSKGFGFRPDDTRKSPSGVSINWSCSLPLLTALSKPPAKPTAAAAAGVHEVTLSAQGCKSGSGRKGPNWNSKKSRSRLCSAAVYEQWQALLAAVPELQQDNAADIATAGPAARPAASGNAGGLGAGGGVCDAGSDLDVQVYRAVKQRVGHQYQQAWSALRQVPLVFAGWLAKP